MNLEDHAGDVIRKGCQAAGLPPETAAQKAGLSLEELQNYQETGQLAKPINFAALGSAAKLDGAKLERLARGWLPAKPEVCKWRELRQITTTGSGMTVNCYLIWDEVSLDAALFDTGWEAAPIFELLQQNGLELRHLFLTHMHEDHIAALEEIRKKYPRAHLHSSAKSAPPQNRNRANDFVHLGSLRISNRDTPGHAEEGVTYIIGNWPDDAPHVAIVGDAIFAGSMGRGNQSWDLARQKVRDQILSLPPTTLICPGHGPLTTVGEEKANNPFF